jgi:hypothetical protein
VKITQTHISETSYNSVTLHLKQVFQSAYRQELGTKLSQKPWKQELAKIPDWPRRKAVVEFRLCVGHGCLGTHLHRNGIRRDPTACCAASTKPWTETILDDVPHYPAGQSVSDTGRPGQK